jgi:UDP-GlcNAc:undecaprenyl-phosphate GlcNAc-1-phosphate transferase
MRGVFLPALAFISSVILIAVLRPLAARLGLVDVPNARKLHAGSVPLVGGIAMFMAILLTVAIDWLIYGVETFLHRSYLAFFVGALIMVIVGSVDDRKGLSTSIRFAAQATAALIMVFGAGIVLRDLGAILPGGYVLQLGWLAIPFTVFTCIGVINAINMSDGLDGLSGNLILVSLLGFGIANSFWGGPGQLALLNIMSAVVAGFLIFNQRIFGRNKAWVFMGDAGSMMLGFLLAWTAIEVSQGDARTLSPAAAMWLLVIPIYDTVAIMIRRVIAGKSPLHPDAEHLHHLLIRLGFSVGEAITIMCLLATAGVTVSIVCEALQVSEFLLAAAFLAIGVGYLLVVDRAWKTRSLFGRAFVPDE